MTEMTIGDVRCWHCHKILIFDAAMVRGRIKCPRCGKPTKIPKPTSENKISEKVNASA